MSSYKRRKEEARGIGKNKFSFADRSKKHAELARAFRMIVADIVGKGERGYTETDINSWSRQLYTLDATEPPSLAALVVLCQNEIALAKNQPEAMYPQNWLVRLLAHFFDMPRSA